MRLTMKKTAIPAAHHVICLCQYSCVLLNQVALYTATTPSTQSVIARATMTQFMPRILRRKGVMERKRAGYFRRFRAAPPVRSGGGASGLRNAGARSGFRPDLRELRHGGEEALRVVVLRVFVDGLG